MDPRDLLPHRYPFLLLDRIESVQRGRRAVGIKQVTGSEWLIVGTRHGAAPRAMPHLLIVEALAQLSAAVVDGVHDYGPGAIGYFMGFDRVRFRGEAVPGDTLVLTVELLQFRRGICRTRGTATVDGRDLVRAHLTTVVRAPAPATATSP
ncbi:MAG: beta-hydroxyacyl-ACP dehydratase [Gemmatimonadaceae bacterium]|nr:beta-hydroxyacyl-ACP dehydratase [Gemmatimonadaceae bacterium]